MSEVAKDLLGKHEQVAFVLEPCVPKLNNQEGCSLSMCC